MKSMLYIGLRVQGGLGTKEDVVQAFLHNKKEYYWKKIRYVMIGGKYECSNDFKMPRNSKLIEHIPESEIKQEWIDADNAAHEFLRHRREVSRAHKMVRNKDWDLIAPLHYRAKRLSLYERWAFADHIRRMILEGKKK